jgi:hypothetical protein
MAHFEDLQPCDYFGPVEGTLLSIGWLNREHAFRKGKVDRSVFDALAKLSTDPWQPFALAGRHPCEFCVFTGGPAQLSVAGVSVPLGSMNVFVPGKRAVYVAPSLVLHYIDAHEYAPPDVFQEAVEACPPMRSIPYLQALHEQGVHRVGKSNDR